MNNDCYVSTAPCGHIRGWISFEAPRKDILSFCLAALRKRYNVTTCRTDDVRGVIGDRCDACDPPEEQCTMVLGQHTTHFSPR